jgi:hypothetical protein
MTIVVGTISFVGLALVVPDDAEAAKKRLRNFTKTDTAIQSGNPQTLVAPHGAQINDPNDPFSYNGVGRIVRITQVSITATITNGNTGPGQDEENDLTLALDGIDTGIKLNGFRTKETDTLTISGTPINTDAIKAALKADGELQASIIDATLGTGAVNIPNTSTTTLTIKGKQKR